MVRLTVKGSTSASGMPKKPPPLEPPLEPLEPLPPLQAESRSVRLSAAEPRYCLRMKRSLTRGVGRAPEAGNQKTEEGAG